MSSKHHLHVAASIPSDLTPNDIIKALHDHNNALTLQALTTGNVKAPSTEPQTLKDTYWYPPDQYPVVTYHVTECITFIPGVGEWAKKYLTFPSCFQDTPHGLKTRADTNGVIVRAEFRVVKGGAGAEVEGEGQGVGDAEWVLIEDVEVSCPWYMMPFVKGKMEEAHRDVCNKIVEKVEMQKRQQKIAEYGRGQRPDTVDENVNTGFSQETRAHYAKPAKQPRDFKGAVEADALESQRVEMSGSPASKVTYS